MLKKCDKKSDIRVIFWQNTTPCIQLAARTTPYRTSPWCTAVYHNVNVPVPTRTVPYPAVLWSVWGTGTGPYSTVPYSSVNIPIWHSALTLGRKRGRSARTLVFAEKKNIMYCQYQNSNQLYRSHSYSLVCYKNVSRVTGYRCHTEQWCSMNRFIPLSKKSTSVPLELFTKQGYVSNLVIRNLRK